MKKIASLFVIWSSFLISATPVNADWSHWFINNEDGFSSDENNEYKIYTVNNESGEKTLRTTHVFDGMDTPGAGAADNGYREGFTFYDPDSGKLIFTNWNNEYEAYDLENDSWEILGTSWRANEPGGGETKGLVINRFPPIRRSGNIISIGDNSLKLRETDTEQQLWGTNADGEIVPLNIINGSKLLINGRDVEQSINNVGALSAALTGLPTVPTDTTLACGLGTGTHGGDFAFSGGCSSKVNEKLSINYAASMTMPGQDYAGNFEDKFSARAGFVWQLGEANKPTQISLKQKKEIDLKISKLENDNELLKADNKELKTKNNEIISQNEKLLARLEKLENIAFKFQKENKYKISRSITE